VELIEAIFLGFIQGATEFLPISSSGHLILIPSLFGLPEPALNIIAIAHLGTLLAVLVYFRRDLQQIIIAVIAGIRSRQLLGTTQSRLGWFIILGSIPAAFAGLLFGDFFERMFGNPNVVAFFLIVTGIILIIGERLLNTRKSLAQMSWGDAGVIGLSQVLALLPGISRSGVTITAGLGRGLDRETAARFSFLLGVPAVAGAGLLAVVDIARSPYANTYWVESVVTFITAALVGYACIHFLLTWLRRRSLYPFAAYCIAFGSLYLLITQIR
jgi:undecaprenyl-diphosphatase